MIKTVSSKSISTIVPDCSVQILEIYGVSGKEHLVKLSLKMLLPAHLHTPALLRIMPLAGKVQSRCTSLCSQGSMVLHYAYIYIWFFVLSNKVCVTIQLFGSLPLSRLVS